MGAGAAKVRPSQEKGPAMSERTIKVWGRPIKIETDQLSETKWRASGEYMGESHQTEDRAEGAAMKRWREWATTKGG